MSSKYGIVLEEPAVAEPVEELVTQEQVTQFVEELFPGFIPKGGFVPKDARSLGKEVYKLFLHAKSNWKFKPGEHRVEPRISTHVMHIADTQRSRLETELREKSQILESLRDATVMLQSQQHKATIDLLVQEIDALNVKLESLGDGMGEEFPKFLLGSKKKISPFDIIDKRKYRDAAMNLLRKMEIIPEDCNIRTERQRVKGPDGSRQKVKNGNAFLVLEDLRR